MSDIGNVSLGVTFTDTTKAARQLAKDVERELTRQLKKGFDASSKESPFESLKRQLTQGFDTPERLKAQEQIKEAIKKDAEAAQQARERELQGISRAEATKRKQINETFAEAEKLRTKGAQSATKNAQTETAAYLRARDAQEKADARAATVKITQAKRASAEAIRLQEKELAFQQRIGKAHAQALKDNEKFDQENKRLGGFAGIFQKATRAIDGADGKLKKFGITTRDISVILGAGLAGGIAFVVRELIQFGVEIVKLAGQVQALRDVSALTFGEFQNIVRDFSRNSAVALGLSERAALDATNQFGLIFQNLGLAQLDAAKFSTALTKIAVAFSRVSGGAQTTEQVIAAITSAFRGEFDALQRFVPKINQATIEQEAFASGISKTGKNLTQQQIALAAINLILDNSEIALDNLSKSELTLAAQQAALNAEWEDAKTVLGEVLLPVVIELFRQISNIVGPVVKLGQAFSDLSAKAKEASVSLSEGKGTLEDLIRVLGPGSNAINVAKSAWGTWARILGISTDKVKEQKAELDTLGALYRAEAKDIQLTKDQLEQLIDARERYLRAILDSERSEEDAERNLLRTREDAARRTRDAQDDISDAVRDRARAMDDAERKITETQVKTARQVRAAQERLADARREDKRAREKEVKELKKVEQDHVDDITEALISIEEAQRKGDAEAENKARRDLARLRQDKSVDEKKKEIAQAQKDRERDIARLERDLHEEKLDRIKDIQDAQREAEETLIDSNEKIGDSLQALADLEIDIKRDLFDAQKRLNDARREGAENVSDIAKDIERLGIKASEAKAKIDAYLDSIERLINIINAPLLPPVEGRTGFEGDGNNKSLADILLESTRAHGGGTHAGQPYVVGEEGIEIVIPRSNSTVVSNDQLLQVLREFLTNKGQNVNQNINIYESIDPEVTAFAIGNRLLRTVLQ